MFGGISLSREPFYERDTTQNLVFAFAYKQDKGSLQNFTSNIKRI